MRKWLVTLFGLLVLGMTHYSIAEREHLLSHGALVLLELRPLDPRSLMQGDYMRLRFEVADRIAQAHAEDQRSGGGVAVLRLDSRGIGAFRRLDNDDTLALQEKRLRYRIRNGNVMLAGGAFFFEEGSAQVYENARYGEFRLAEDGGAVLMHLRDKDLKRLTAE